MRGIRRCLAVVALCAGVAMTHGVLLAPAASADQVSNSKVGTITGYVVSSVKDYRGTSKAAQNNQCVVVERKSGVGWTGSYVTGSKNCTRFPAAWLITNDAAFDSTIAIRLRVYSGPYSPSSFVNICNSRSECRAMRR